jgi:hypothetical protein
VTQPASSCPKPPPFSAHSSSSSIQHQIHQTTNPHNQPHHYNTPAAYTSAPIQPFYPPPHIPLPYPYYSPPPQHPPYFQYNQPNQFYPAYTPNSTPYYPSTPTQNFSPPTYTSTQPTILPQPQPTPDLHQRTTYCPTPQQQISENRFINQTHSQVEPHIRSPTVELPLFYGDNAYQWLQDCEGIFELAGITNDYKMKWAAAHIRGKAKTWLNNCNVPLSLMNWTQYCELLLDRFPDSGIHESMEQFQQLKQSNTVNQYIDLFEEWMTAMKRDHNYLPEYFFMLRFLSGLKDTIKHAVKCHKPPDLRSAYWYARQEELAYLSINKKQSNPPTPAKIPPVQQSNRNTNFRENRMRPPADRNKEKGKCWYCPEDWTFGHKCTGIKSMVHAIEMQGR